MADNLSSEQRVRYDEICDRAMQLPPEKREAFVREACGDDGVLRDAVLGLLAELGDVSAVDEDATASIGADAQGSAPLMYDRDADPLVGSTIADRYHVLGVLGEGGFGIVYEAEQTKPVKRRVALKVLKPGMDSRSVLARFEAERQALAIMDHPGIARVLDAGETERGLPFFAMEIVRGTPITEYCDRQRMSIDQRLELFATVCDAIQHAHTKAIIHRDIKPSNILVEVRDGSDPLPKVIDFGIAKAMAQKLTEKTLFTERGQLIGTPEYMSPEQAEMTGDDIDTRSDVYSLGVLLYELLTGERPFNLREAAFIEIQRVIREQEPPKPSTRLTSLGDAATRIAESRRTDPRSLSGALKRELEWIPLRALRKDRTERYRTAADFGDDVRRYLAGEALEAGPPSTAYKLQKFVQRNRGPVLFIGTAASVVIAIAVIAVWQSQRATRAELDAAEARLVQQETEFKLRQAEASAEQAEVLSDYLSSLWGVLTSLSGDTLIPPEARNRLWRGVLEEFEALQKLHAQSSGPAVEQLGRAFRELGFALGGGSGANRGDTQGAVDAFQKAAVIHEQNGDVGWIPATSFSLAAVARHDAGNTLMDMGRLDAAEASFFRGRELLGRVPESEPKLAIRRALDASILNNLGEIRGRQCDLDGGIALAEQALSIRRALLNEARGTNSEWLASRRVALSLATIATLRRASGDLVAAESAIRDSLVIRETLVAQRPEDSRARSDVAQAEAVLGAILAEQQQVDAVPEQLEAAVEQHQRMMRESPDDATTFEDHARARITIAEVRLRSGDYGNATAAAQLAIDAVDELEAVAIADAHLPELRAKAFSVAGRASLAASDPIAAAEYARMAISGFEALCAASPDSPEHAPRLAESLVTLADAMRATAEADGGETDATDMVLGLFRRAEAIYEELAKAGRDCFVADGARESLRAKIVSVGEVSSSP